MREGDFSGWFYPCNCRERKGADAMAIWDDSPLPGFAPPNICPLPAEVQSSREALALQELLLSLNRSLLRDTQDWHIVAGHLFPQNPPRGHLSSQESQGIA